MTAWPHRIQVVDSHTEGEPTRVVISGGPALPRGSVTAQLDQLRQQHDRFRAAVINEPRGSDVLVGALLCEPADARCCTGVIFFNNVGYLGMCGHGTIGVVKTLWHLGRITLGSHRIETPVGVVSALLHDDGRVSVTNVPSYRAAKAVTIEVAGHGPLHADIAWGGNWFALCEDHGQELAIANVASLTAFALRVRTAVNAQGFPLVDHVELFGPARSAGARSRNFVLCPGGAYDRSPCGTGTSAKVACLAADGKLAEGERWVQEGILGTSFTATYQHVGDQIVPMITGTAHITAESTLIVNAADPFGWGIS